MADNETIADIIAEKRQQADELEASSYRPHQFLRERIAELRQEADRLEAARKRDTKELRVEIERLKEERNYSGVRERERLRANGFAIVPKEQLERGDAAKLREALEELVANIEMRSSTFGLNVMVDTKTFLDAKAALAEPVKNYEVGTAEEQWKRFDEFCDAWQESAPVEICSDECPVIKMKNIGCDGCQGRSGCYALWAQMPYVEKEGGAK